MLRFALLLPLGLALIGAGACCEWSDSCEVDPETPQAGLVVAPDAFVTPGCPTAAISEGGDGEICAGCDGLGAICGEPVVATCEVRENAFGSSCQLCVADDGAILYDDCFSDGDVLGPARCESEIADPASSQTCDTCYDSEGNQVSRTCRPVHDRCEPVVVDGRGCERCFNGEAVAFTSCEAVTIDPRVCQAYGNDIGRCVDCFDDDHRLISHACSPANPDDGVLSCATNVLPEGLVCEVCNDENGMPVSRSCGAPASLVTRCERLAFTEQTCVVCIADEGNVDPTSGFLFVDCERNDCASLAPESQACRQDTDCAEGQLCNSGHCTSLDGPADPGLCAPPPACVTEVGNGGALCRTCPVEADGTTQTLCITDGAFVCEEVNADPLPEEEADAVGSCVVCRDSGSGIEVYSDCNNVPPPYCMDESDGNGGFCQVCYDPVTRAPVYSSCAEQTCFDLDTRVLSNDQGTSLVAVDGQEAVATCSQCSSSGGAFIPSCSLENVCPSDFGRMECVEPTVALRVAPRSCGNPWDAATASGGSASIGDAEELIRILAWALVEHRVSLASVTPSQTGFGSCPAVHDPDACSCRGDVLEVLVRSPDEATMRAALASVLLPP